MKIDAFAHISPIRYLERVEAILAAPGASAAVREHGPWLREDPVLYDLDARGRAPGAVRRLPPGARAGERRRSRSWASRPSPATWPGSRTTRWRRSCATTTASSASPPALPLNDVDAGLEELRRAVRRPGRARLPGLLQRERPAARRPPLPRRCSPWPRSSTSRSGCTRPAARPGRTTRSRRRRSTASGGRSAGRSRRRRRCAGWSTPASGGAPAACGS